MNKMLWIFLMAILVFKIEAKSEKIAIACMFQNEALYLKEWIEYHRLVGVKHFYLWNNHSEDNYLAVLNPYIKKGIVELFQAQDEVQNLKEQTAAQERCMDEALRLAENGGYDWIIMIDSDEFVVPMQKNTIQEVLEEFQEFAGISIQWICFGTSNVKKIPKNKLMIEVLTYRGPYDFFFNGAEKWILRPESVIRMNMMHFPIFKEGAASANQSKQSPGEWRVDPVHGPDKIRLNHYWSRDEDYFNRVKIPRQAKWDNYCLDRLMECKTTLNTCQDDSMQRFIAPLRKRIFGKKENK